MANLNLPTPGEKPWGTKLNTEIEKINAETTSVATIISEGRLSEAGLSAAIGEGVEAVTALAAARTELNILDFGVLRNTPASQSAAILAALVANPGATFYFPRGNYGLSSTLHIQSGNSIHLGAESRLYAMNAMPVLVKFSNEQTSVRFWDADKGIYGRGLLDGMLLATDVLHVSSVLRFTIGAGLSIKDPIERGLVTGPRGAEIMADNLRVYNTTNANVINSIGIESTIADSSFSRIVVRDFTVGAKESGPNFWTDFHPWIGTIFDQVPARYENSVGFWVHGARATLTNGYIDTYRTRIKVTREPGSPDNGRAIVNNLRSVTGSSTVVTDTLIAYPGRMFDIGTTCIVDANFGFYNTRSDVPATFIIGDASKTTIRGGDITPGAVTGFSEMEKGTLIGNRAWTPTIIGADVAGDHAYTIQSGRMNVSRDGMVTWSFQIKATLDGAVSGIMRIAGAPFPTGAQNIQISPMGTVAFSSANLASASIHPTSLQAGTWGAAATGVVNVLRGNGNLQLLPLRGQVVEIYGTFSAPYSTVTI